MAYKVGAQGVGGPCQDDRYGTVAKQASAFNTALLGNDSCFHIRLQTQQLGGVAKPHQADQVAGSLNWCAALAAEAGLFELQGQLFDYRRYRLCSHLSAGLVPVRVGAVIDFAPSGCLGQWLQQVDRGDAL